MSQRIKELRETCARSHAAAKALLDTVPADAKPEVRAEAERQFDGFMSDYDKAEAEISRLERLAAGEERLSQRSAAEPEQERRAAASRRPGDNGRAPGSDRPGGEVSMRSAFKDALIYGTDADPESIAFLQEKGVMQIRGNQIADRELRALTTGTGSSGGFVVPTEFLPRIEQTMAVWGPMLDGNVIDLLTTDSGAPIEFPSIDDTAARGAQFAENGEITDDGGQDPSFGQITLASYMHNSEIIRVPIQLLTDSAFDVESRLMPDLFGERMARTANDRLTIGTGSSQPQGIVIGAGAGVTAASVSAFAADELIDLQHEVNPAYRASPKCGWMFNDTVLKLARKLKDSENRYIWQAPNISTGAPATLLDKPYYINPSMADPGASAKPIVFGDLSKFITRRVGNFTIFVFRERYMNNSQLGFMAYARLDGRVINTAAIKVMTMAAA